MTTNRSETLGDLLRRYRQEAGLTQEELAERANLSARAISELERGARQYPYRTTIQLLASALALSHEQVTRLEQAGRRPSAGSRSGSVSSSGAGIAESVASVSVEHKHNLPAQLTSFVGRSSELARIRDLLLREEVRLLTLTGPPGTGKTRLSLEVGVEVLAEFDDGVFFVELAAVSELALVASTVATTLGVKETAGRSLVEGLKQFLKKKQLLLVLDNFEQVLDAAPFVNELLVACPLLKTLVTSREALRLRAEKEFPVLPMTVPDPRHPRQSSSLPSLQRLVQYEAVQLFVERARDTKPDFGLTEENARAVVEICQRLDGLPLALELAAAHIRIFSPQAMTGRLQHSLALLTAGAFDMPVRQRTLRAAIDWSHDLLSEQEKKLFRRLAVFAGGCTLEAIAAVCDQGGEGGDLQARVLEGVESLVGKNLLQQREGHGHEPRFAMLEMIREYAHEKLAQSRELEELSWRHTVYCMQLAEQAEPSLQGPHPTEWLDKLEDEHENVRAALEWTLGDPVDSGDAPQVRQQIGLHLCAALGTFWYLKGHLSEGRRWLEAALQQDFTREPGAEAETDQTEADQIELDRARARALIGAGWLAMGQTELVMARTLIDEGLRLSRTLGYKRGILMGLNAGWETAGRQGDPMFKDFLAEGLALSRELEDKHIAAMVLNELGQTALKECDPATARALYEESLAINKEQGDKAGIALTLIFLGELALEEDELGAARALFEESLARSGELGNKLFVCLALRDLASVALAQDELTRARAYCEESLVICRELLERRGIAHCFAIMAGVVARSGSGGRRAATLVGATEALLEATTTSLWIAQQRIYEQASAMARELLGEEGFEKARLEGRAMSMEQAIEYALEGAHGGYP